MVRLLDMKRDMSAACAWGAVAGTPGLTNAELGRRLGVERRQAWQWLSGERSPSAATLRRLSVELGRPVEAILRACELARERRLARLAAETAAKEADER